LVENAESRNVAGGSSSWVARLAVEGMSGRDAGDGVVVVREVVAITGTGMGTAWCSGVIMIGDWGMAGD